MTLKTTKRICFWMVPINVILAFIDYDKGDWGFFAFDLIFFVIGLGSYFIAGRLMEEEPPSFT